MRRSKVKQNISTLIFISFAIFLIAGTYSRYTSTGQANLTTSIAKWSIALTGDNKDLTLEETQTITFKVDDNENVVNNKIAPGVTATAIVELDLTGTEVAVDFDATIDTASYNASTVGTSFDKLSLVTKLGDTTLQSGVYQLINLENNAAFTAANGKKTITLELTWENDDLNNVDDTTMGITKRTIVVPITFTAKQHIIANATVTQGTTLAQAIASSNEGGTVSVTQDLSFVEATNGSYSLYKFPDNSTFDLQGQTITVDNSAVANGNVNYAGNNLTIKNGTFVTSGDTGGRNYMQVWGYDGADYDEPMTNVTLENVNATGGINLYNAYNVVFRDVTSTATNYYAVFCNPDVTLTIESGTYSTTSNSRALLAYYGTNPDDGFKIYGGTFRTNGKPLFLSGASYKPAKIYGGTFDTDVSNYVASGYECVADPDNAGMYIVRAIQ